MDLSTPTPSVQDGATPSHLEAPVGLDTDVAVTQGAVAAGMESQKGFKAVSQYTIVFDDPEQQSRWFRFVRWLKTDPSYDGDSVAERILNFIDAHADYE